MHETLSERHLPRTALGIFLRAGGFFFFLFLFLVVPKETVHLLLFLTEIIKYFTSVVMVTPCAVDATFACLFLALFRNEGQYSRV